MFRPDRNTYLSLERKADRLLGPLLLRAWMPFAPRGGTPPSPEGARRVLLVKLHGIGNLVLILPVLRRLRRHFRHARFDFLTFRGNEEILEGTPALETVLLLERRAPFPLLSSAARILSALRKRPYDLVIDFDQFAHVSSIFALATGAGCRVGFRNPTLRRHDAYTIPVAGLDTAHVSRTFDRLADAAGAPPAGDEDRRIDLSPGHREEAGRFLAEAGIVPGEPFAVLHPGTSRNHPLRRWPPDRFARLGDLLAARHGLRVVLTGSRDEEELIGRVRGGMETSPVPCAGLLSIKGFAALCERAAMVVANDTSAAHIASAMGTPVVGFYGPNTPFLYGPLGGDDLVFFAGMPCSPCLSNMTYKLSGCRRPACMEAIAVEDVYDAVRRRYFDERGRLLERFRIRSALPAGFPAEVATPS